MKRRNHCIISFFLPHKKKEVRSKRKMMYGKILRICFLVALRGIALTALVIEPQRQRASIKGFTKKWAGATVLASTLIGQSFLFPQSTRAVEAPATALVVNVDVSDPKSLAKSIFDHRNGLAAAAKDFVQSIKTLGADLDGVIPSDSASFSVQLPSDVKAAARDAASGVGRIILNGSPIYVEVESEQEFLSLRVLVSSPLLPKIPFLAPTQETIQIPPTFRVQKTEVAVAGSASVPASTKPVEFLELTFTVPVINAQLTILQAIEGVLLAIPAVYTLSYGFYVWENEENAKQAAAKKNKSKK